MIIYAAIACFGFLVLLFMILAGDLLGGDHEIGGHDMSVDHPDVEGGGGPSIFSARIMASFVTAFGVGGVVGRYYGLTHPAASAVGIVAGVVMASAVYEFAKILYTQQASSEVHMSGLVGRTASVTVAIPEGGVGQVALTVAGEHTEQIARAGDGHAIARGVEVTVTGLRGESVVVAPAAVAAGPAPSPSTGARGSLSTVEGSERSESKGGAK